MWWNIAASSGYEYATASPPGFLKLMTPAQIEKAKQLTRECVAKNYKDC
jgi:hypothetical protein